VRLPTVAVIKKLSPFAGVSPHQRWATGLLVVRERLGEGALENIGYGIGWGNRTPTKKRAK